MRELPVLGYGEPVEWPTDKWLPLGCCDCGLIHMVRARVIGRRLVLEFKRHQRATENVRKLHGIRKLKVCGATSR